MRIQIVFSSLIAALALVSCQSPPTQGTTTTPPPPPSVPTPQTTMTTASPPPGKTSSIELTYEKSCPGMEQPRSVRLSSATGKLGLADQSGEARLVQLPPARIAAFTEALRKAGVDKLTSSPRKGAAPPTCTATLHIVLDGAARDIEESPASEVNDPAAWKEVQSVIEELATGKR